MIKKEPEIKLDYLCDELQEFIAKVTDVTRKRWIKNWSPETIEATIERVYEWCHATDHEPKSVGGLIATFFKRVPKDAKGSEGLSPKITSELDKLLEGK